jgi:hypothetical protein
MCLEKAYHLPDLGQVDRAEMWSQIQDWSVSGCCLDDDPECAVKRRVREDFKLPRTC